MQMWKSKAYKVEKVELSSIDILEKMIVEGRQLIKETKKRANDLAGDLAKLNREISSVPSKMESAANSFIKSAQAIGLKKDDMIEAEVVLKLAEQLSELQNGLARAAMAVKREI